MSKFTKEGILWGTAQSINEYRRQAMVEIQHGRDAEASDAQLGRWLSACEKARIQLEYSAIDGGKLDQWYELEGTNGMVVFSSSSSGKQVYTQDDECTPCRANENGNPCWHRAAVMIIHFCKEHRHQEEAAARRVKVSTKTMEQVQAEVDELF